MSGKRKHKEEEFMDSGGKMPPQNMDLEAQVLGAIMIQGRLADKVMTELDPSIFFSESNSRIAEAIQSLYKKSAIIDVSTVIAELKAMAALDFVGGAYYIAQLTAQVFSTASIEYNIKILQQEALKRKIISLCGRAMREAYTDTEDVFQVYQGLINNLDNEFKIIIRSEAKSAKDIYEKMLKEAMQVAEHGVKSGVPSGLSALDDFTNGFQRSDLIIIAGRPSMGKTALAMTIARNASFDYGKPVAVWSLEMSSQQLIARLAATESEIDVSRIVKKQLSMEEIAEIGLKGQKIEKAPLFIDDTPSISLTTLKAKARRLKAEHNIELIVIDYLQLMRSDNKHHNREQEIAEISRGLKALAKELDIPIIALAQLSRAVETRGGDKKPTLSDLRESGQIEQDADMVIFPYRPEYYHIDSYEVGNKVFDVHGLLVNIIAKHRNGGLGEIVHKFIHRLTKVDNYTEHGYGQSRFVSSPDASGAPAGPTNPPDTSGGLNIADLGRRLITEKENDDNLPF